MQILKQHCFLIIFLILINILSKIKSQTYELEFETLEDELNEGLLDKFDIFDYEGEEDNINNNGEVDDLINDDEIEQQLDAVEEFLGEYEVENLKSSHKYLNRYLADYEKVEEAQLNMLARQLAIKLCKNKLKYNIYI